MDTLTFNAPTLYRHLTFSEAKKQPISEINLEKALQGLDMNMSQVLPRMIQHLLLFMPHSSSSSTYVYYWDAITWSPLEAWVPSLLSSSSESTADLQAWSNIYVKSELLISIILSLINSFLYLCAFANRPPPRYSTNQ